ncbi:MAG: hypothetical protein IPO62_17690 [Saprospiraceae bacterium]|nr:hypothetical protein [Saprospiraceae bacterium]
MIIKSKLRNSNATDYYFEQLNYRFFSVNIEAKSNINYLEVRRALYLTKFINLSFVDKMKLCLDPYIVDNLLINLNNCANKSNSTTSINYYFLIKTDDVISLRYVKKDSVKNIYIDNIEPLSNKNIFVFVGAKLFLPLI